MVADILCEFLEVAIHLILYVREVYPSGIFQKKKKYNVPVQVNSMDHLLAILDFFFFIGHRSTSFAHSWCCFPGLFRRCHAIQNWTSISKIHSTVWSHSLKRWGFDASRPTVKRGWFEPTCLKYPFLYFQNDAEKVAVVIMDKEHHPVERFVFEISQPPLLSIRYVCILGLLAKRTLTTKCCLILVKKTQKKTQCEMILKFKFIAIAKND